MDAPLKPASKAARWRRLRCGWRYEREARSQGAQRIAGVDEVGRGALFGPVVAAAVIFDGEPRLRGIKDSKQLTAEEREAWEARIQETAHCWAIAACDAGRIELINIYQASRQAMLDALRRLAAPPDWLLVDAVRLDWTGPQQAIVHGDALSVTIAAASILAKQHRDRLMRQWDKVYPQYGLFRNKGYATAEHIAALLRHGPSPQHRRSFLRELTAPQLFAAAEEKCIEGTPKKATN